MKNNQTLVQTDLHHADLCYARVSFFNLCHCPLVGLNITVR